MEQEQYLEFEKPVAELESKIEGLRHLSGAEDGVSIADEISRLQKKVEKQINQLYAKLDIGGAVRNKRAQLAALFGTKY